MSLGKRKSRFEFLPVIKWDAANVGIFCKEDRVCNSAGAWGPEQTNIPNDEFAAIVDLKNAEVGWVKFATGTAPDLRAVLVGQDHGDSPGADFSECVRLIVQLDGAHAEVGPRELISTAVGLWYAVCDLHDQYLAKTAKHPGMLPVVAIDSVRETKGKRTTYAPVFKITGWEKRPPGLPLAGIAKRTAKKSSGNGVAVEPRPKPDDGMQDEIPFS